ncbi:MAG: hypothetical protein ABR582_11955 [Gemmatimonadaceae bacterium]
MRHFFRTQLLPADVLKVADEFFPTLPLDRTAHTARSRTYSGMLGTLHLTVKKEGGHYTFVQIQTDQIGESRLDRNAKRYFLKLHRVADPAHKLEAAY